MHDMSECFAFSMKAGNAHRYPSLTIYQSFMALEYVCLLVLVSVCILARVCLCARPQRYDTIIITHIFLYTLKGLLIFLIWKYLSQSCVIARGGRRVE